MCLFTSWGCQTPRILPVKNIKLKDVNKDRTEKEKRKTNTNNINNCRGHGLESRWSLRIFLQGSLSLVFFNCSALVWSFSTIYTSQQLYWYNLVLSDYRIMINLNRLWLKQLIKPTPRIHCHTLNFGSCIPLLETLQQLSFTQWM